jgi:hypothetical protein
MASSVILALPPVSAESLRALRLCQSPAIPPESCRYIRIAAPTACSRRVLESGNTPHQVGGKLAFAYDSKTIELSHDTGGSENALSTCVCELA